MRNALVAALLLALSSGPVHALDVWDQATEDDDNSETDNVLVHGTVQVHDLQAVAGVADQDWFQVPVPPYSSVEVVVDSVTGDLYDLANLAVQRVLANGSAVQTSERIHGALGARRLSWRNDTDTEQMHYVRVAGAACATSCTSGDQYTIRMRETQVALARFNNSGTQVTVLLVQNASPVAISSKVYFWSASGDLLSTYSITNQQPKMLSVIQTQTVVSGQSGSITIAHDGPHYGINAKAVALEPATGFSFDTPGVVRP